MAWRRNIATEPDSPALLAEGIALEEEAQTLGLRPPTEQAEAATASSWGKRRVAR